MPITGRYWMPKEIEMEMGRGFAVRLARRLQLKPIQGHSFEIVSSNGTIQVSISKELNSEECERRHLPPRTRAVAIQGMLRWQGMEYEISVNNWDGSGRLGPDDEAYVYDRAANCHLDGDMPHKVYETLMPLIELEVADILRRARAKKH